MEKETERQKINLKKKIPISKSIEWLRPYLGLADMIMPNLGVLKRITAKKPKRLEDADSALLTKIGPNAFKIILYLGEWKTDPDTKTMSYSKYSKMDLLDSLAHELSHIAMSIHAGQIWRLHHPKGRGFQAELVGLFMVQLENEGYTTEEDEIAQFL